jgi:hypothetical protein
VRFPESVAKYAGSVPTVELVWARASADGPMIRRARWSVFRGVAAGGIDAARVALALAHDAQHRALSQGVIAFRYLLGAAFLALSLHSLTGLTGSGRWVCVALGVVSATLLCTTLWASRAAYERGSRSEQANMALLEAAGVVYQPAPNSASIAIAPGRLLGAALAVFAIVDVGIGLCVVSSVGRAPLSPPTVALAGAPIAVACAGSVLRSVCVWRPDASRTRPS